MRTVGGFPPSVFRIVQEKVGAMPILIVEDGTMPLGSNVYASVADADTWLVPRLLWPETPLVEAVPDVEILGKKEAALLRAADWLNALPGGRWKDEPAVLGRVMAWPRKNPATMVPDAVKIANMELAAIFYNGADPLAPVEHGGKVLSEAHSASSGVDVISTSTSDSKTYAADAPVETYYPAIVGLLQEWLAVAPGQRSGGVVVAMKRG